MVQVIKRFIEVKNIKLIAGQLGFCLEDETLYIGTDDGYLAVSSDSASIAELKEQVSKLRDDADTIFIELTDRAEKAIKLLDKAKESKEYLDAKADEIDQKHDKENEKLNNNLAEIDKKHEEENEKLDKKVDDEVERLDDRIDKTNEVLNRPIEYKDAVPDYSEMKTTNLFEDDLEWEADKSGFVLVEVKGLCDFEVLMNNKPLIRKVLENDPTRTDLEVIFSQVFRISKDDKIAINEISKKYASYSCKFIPHKLIDVGFGYRSDQKDLVDLIYPVGSIYIATVATNPNVLFGKGNWESFGTGRTLVGISSGETEFNSVEKQGGAKTHILAATEMPQHTHTSAAHTHTGPSHTHTTPNHFHTGPSHSHTITFSVLTNTNINASGGTIGSNTANAYTGTLSSSNRFKRMYGAIQYQDQTSGNGDTIYPLSVNSANYNYGYYIYNGNSGTGNTGNAAPTTDASGTGNTGSTTPNATGAVGGGLSHNNLQPYITVYMWKRTA